MSQGDPSSDQPTRTSGRPRLGLRIGLACIALAVALISIEVVLQLGALIVGGESRMRSPAGPAEGLSVLCMGDSNTWGVYVEPDETYPAQLEARWAASGGAPIRVFNLGYPGVNSSRVRGDLRRSLELVRPDFTIVMVGANDHWTTAVEDPATSEAESKSVLDVIREHSRLYMLVYMLAQSTQDRDHSATDRSDEDGQLTLGEETFDFSYEERPLGNRPNPRGPMLDNLHEIVRRARAVGTTLVLMTYPAQETKMYYPFASNQIRQVAEETGTPLIDLHRLFGDHCRDDPCRRLLYEDGHANAAGYRIIADEVAKTLRALLAEEGG